MHRFFVPPELLEGEQVRVTGPLVHRIAHVLRVKRGEHILLLDNSGWEHEVEVLSLGPREVLGRKVQRRLAQGEPRTKITLYQAILKAKGFELVLEKGTELGLVSFVPVVASRCIVGSLEEISQAKVQRWKNIIQGGAEQARRGRLPVLRPPMMLHGAWEEAAKSGTTIIPWEEETERSLKEALATNPRPFAINLLIGPEGGFTQEEIEEGKNYGAIPVTLGPRILKAETAGLIAATAILYELGDMV
jgi:16S rRNA (uracil1498-N3)-methyltransferase